MIRTKLEKLVEELKLSQSLLGNRALNLLDDGDLEKYGYYNGQRIVCERIQKQIEQILEVKK